MPRRSPHSIYATLVDRHSVDTIILVDGGTDSLMVGDAVPPALDRKLTPEDRLFVWPLMSMIFAFDVEAIRSGPPKSCRRVSGAGRSRALPRWSESGLGGSSDRRHAAGTRVFRDRPRLAVQERASRPRARGRSGTPQGRRTTVRRPEEFSGAPGPRPRHRVPRPGMRPNLALTALALQAGGNARQLTRSAVALRIVPDDLVSTGEGSLHVVEVDEESAEQTAIDVLSGGSSAKVSSPTLIGLGGARTFEAPVRFRE